MDRYSEFVQKVWNTLYGGRDEVIYNLACKWLSADIASIILETFESSKPAIGELLKYWSDKGFAAEEVIKVFESHRSLLLYENAKRQIAASQLLEEWNKLRVEQEYAELLRKR